MVESKFNTFVLPPFLHLSYISINSTLRSVGRAEKYSNKKKKKNRRKEKKILTQRNHLMSLRKGEKICRTKISLFFHFDPGMVIRYAAASF